MKKIIFSVAVLLFVTNCVLLDNLGLNMVKPTIKGSEAKNLILTNALMGAGASGNSSAVATSIATYNTVGLKDDKFYDKTDVDSCAETVLVINAAGGASNGVAIGSLACNGIREHKMLIDWPDRKSVV